MSEHPQKKRRVLMVIQAGVSCVLLVWLFSRQDFRGNLVAVLFSADPWWLLGGFLLAGVVQGLCLVRWKIFLKMAGVEIGWGEAGAVFFAGLFSNLFLPGGAGGDVVKIGLLATRGRDVGRVAVSVVMDRLAGSVSMIVLGGMLMTWQWEWLSKSSVVAGLVHSIAAYLLVLACLVGLSVFFSAGGIVSKLPLKWPGRKRLLELSGVYFQCAVQWPRTLLALALSLTMLFLFFVTYFCSSLAYGINLPMGEFLAVMPTVDIISGLPVSLGGVGVRENLFALLLGDLAAVPGPVAVSVSLGGYLMTSLWGVPGAFYWLVKKEVRS